MVAAGCGLLTSLAGESLRAQAVRIDAGITSELAWTSNARLGQSDRGEDMIITVQPTLSVRAEGARLRINGKGVLSAIAYARGEQDNRLVPEGDLSASVEAVERLFFIDTRLRASQTRANPFGAPSGGTETDNTLTATQVRFSPYIKQDIGRDLHYLLRSDIAWVRGYGADLPPGSGSANGRYSRHSIVVEQHPRPLGWKLDAESSRTDYDDASEPLTLDVARASLEYAIGGDLVVGVRGGAERNSFIPDEKVHAIHGLHVRWRPTERTVLAAFREQRYFGPGWGLEFSHRRPLLAFNVVLSRGVETAQQSLFELPPTDNVAALLDAMFTTRIPNAADRARAVQDLLARSGLPASTLQAINLFSQRVSLVTNRHASVSLNGVRNSVTLDFFHSRTEDAPESGALALGSSLTNNTQSGVSVAVSRRLTPASGLSLLLERGRIRALPIAGNEETTHTGAQLRMRTGVGPRSAFFVGARYRDFESNVLTDGHETVVFVGLDHRF